MLRCFGLVAVLSLLGRPVPAQNPWLHYTDAIGARFSRSQPVVTYTLRIDSADLTGWTVEMRLRNLPDTFRLAMAAHPEYDDRFYRYVTQLAITSPRGGGSITRVDSAVWLAVAPGGEAVVRYRIQLPEPTQPPRAAWRPFLRPTGGLTGGPHAFMYLLGAELAPAHVKLDLPNHWKVATGLESTSDPAVFFAPSIDVLVESPIFVGRFHDWGFAIDGVPHRVVYWSAPDGSRFDSTRFVAGLEKLALQAVALFGRPPYREYTFVFQDAAYGGLEHPNSVTLGAPSGDLAKDPDAALEETAHEFFHTWNLMRIRPEEYRSVTYRTQPPTAGLWFSEGLTIFYADLLRRRAGLPVRDSTRQVRLEALLSRYLANPGNAIFSAESVSKVEYNAGPGALGDYTGNSHLVGEVIGSVLDLTVLEATGGQRSMDDVMRLLLEQHGGNRGFNGRDIERVVEAVCRCEISPLFDAHVRRGGKPIDFDRYLAPFGWRTEVSWKPAVWNNQVERDLRIWGWEPEGERGIRLILNDPGSIWGKAGLHTHDRLVSINGKPLRTWLEFRSVLIGAQMGDTLAFEVLRGSEPFRTTVKMAGFERPHVRLVNVGTLTPAQSRLREFWNSFGSEQGNPTIGHRDPQRP
jgi:predicted metalloprotease with PDZ domain